ncbi:unnamed protein product [Heterobilharzia americana]|nr:unnamed protein product [Heterobilharzia americana]
MRIIGHISHLHGTIIQTSRRYSVSVDEVYMKSLLNKLGQKSVASPSHSETKDMKNTHGMSRNPQDGDFFKGNENLSVSKWNFVKPSKKLVRDSSVPLKNPIGFGVALRTAESLHREVKDVQTHSQSLPDIGKLPPKNIRSYLSPNQTPTESIVLLQQWFKELELNDLVRVLPTCGNLAAYVPNCFTLSQLVKLGVDLSKIEAVPGVANMLMKLDFHADIEPVLWRLADFGFKPEQIARIITIFPKIFKLSLEEISSRISYFTDRRVFLTDVVTMVHKKPTILEIPSIEIDKHLGQIKSLLKLKNSEVVNLITTEPKIILHPLSKIKDVFVVLSKMMGFSESVVQNLVLANPKLLVTVDQIQMWPEALSAAPHLLYQRCTFLVRRNLFQPDPTKPLYTPLSTIVIQEDKEFCQKYGFTTEDDYDNFLRTL